MGKFDLFVEPGRFHAGCNYWASHAGTDMWRNWRADVVAQDMRQLAAGGLGVLRVFPLWPDFQPLTLLRASCGRPIETRFGEQPFGDDEAGRAGVSSQAIGHFEELVCMAEKHGLKLIVGLLTGWMSGRLFVPPALEGLNVLCDPTAVLWEQRFVKYFVRRFRACAAIAAWDLGNECNVMGLATTDQAATWTATISAAIRAEDASRPIVSGMHSLTPLATGPWRIQDQAEWTDVLTTHPYPLFTPHCDHDPINTIRPGLHATAESRFYADIGQKPCMVEEIGTLGPTICDERTAADYARVAMLSSWVHDCRGLLWWCAYDQSHLAHAPYDWNGVERELGLFRVNREAKPVAEEMARLSRFFREFPLGSLPPHSVEAVCILTPDQDCWAAAFAAFILAKQAGFDLSFQYADQPIRPSRLYLLPSLHGTSSISRRRWLELLDRVAGGATLYVSLHDGMPSPFNEPFGLEILTRERRGRAAGFQLDGIDGQPAFEVPATFRFNLASKGADILGRETDGNPVLTSASWGKGKAVMLSVPLEEYLSQTPGVFHKEDAPPYWSIYEYLARPQLHNRVVRKRQPRIGVTEHPVDDARRVVAVINYSPQPIDAQLAISAGWGLDQCFYGPRPSGSQAMVCSLKGNDAAVFSLSRR